jgi:aminopeptidase
MPDPRVVKLARLLVEYSTRIRKGDRVALEAQPAADPLVRALFEKVLDAGGHPFVFYTPPWWSEDLIRYGNPEQVAGGSALRKEAYERFDSRIRIYSESNTRSLTGSDPAREAVYKDALGEIIRIQMDRGARGEFRWLTTLYPTEAYAQDADMSLKEFEDFVYQACHVDDGTPDPVAYWNGVKKSQEHIVEALRGHDRVQVRGPNCDLALSIKGRVFLNAFGDHNMPDGEVFTGPVEESVNGWIRFTYPAIHEGHEVDGVELRFAEGRVTEAKAEKNLPYLLRMIDGDVGGRYLGEFAIGNNFGVQRFTGQILFDEKIGGTIHVALGSGYPETGSKNKSAIHWDMICDMRGGGEILVDGDLIYRDGGFQI